MACFVHAAAPEVVPRRVPTMVTPALRRCAQAHLLHCSGDAVWAAIHECCIATVHRTRCATYLQVVATNAAFARRARRRGAALPPALKPEAAFTQGIADVRDALLAPVRSVATAVDAIVHRLGDAVAAIKAEAGGRAQDPCRRCRSDNTTTTTKQSRSADEGATMVCHCNDCGYSWQYNT